MTPKPNSNEEKEPRTLKKTILEVHVFCSSSLGLPRALESSTRKAPLWGSKWFKGKLGSLVSGFSLSLSFIYLFIFKDFYFTVRERRGRGKRRVGERVPSKLHTERRAWHKAQISWLWDHDLGGNQELDTNQLSHPGAPGLVSIDWFFSSLRVIFSCCFACLPIFDKVLDINFNIWCWLFLCSYRYSWSFCWDKIKLLCSCVILLSLVFKIC